VPRGLVREWRRDVGRFVQRHRLLPGDHDDHVRRLRL
jgi:hypothetical protein